MSKSVYVRLFVPVAQAMEVVVAGDGVAANGVMGAPGIAGRANDVDGDTKPQVDAVVPPASLVDPGLDPGFGVVVPVVSVGGCCDFVAHDARQGARKRAQAKGAWRSKSMTGS
jgi:hypothetical protein